MLDKVYTLLKSIGMTPEEVVLKWIEEGKIDLNRIEELAKQIEQNKSSEIKKLKQVKAGMFLTRNKTICNEFIPDECEAIILKVIADTGEALVFNITGQTLAFAREGIAVDTTDFSGLNATHFVSQMAKDMNVTPEAADYCLEFENAFVTKGNAFLLSKEEVADLVDVEAICKSFEAAKLADKTFWTSTTPADSLKSDDEIFQTAYIFSLRGSRITLHSEYVSLPLCVHPAYKVKLKQIL
ncbi:MAG: hypothetical protein IJ532_07380 [Alphaproteobacteria bacterium]|nr:hypothetical protein [Alphaproteobacteria bacterium]